MRFEYVRPCCFFTTLGSVNLGSWMTGGQKMIRYFAPKYCPTVEKKIRPLSVCAIENRSGAWESFSCFSERKQWVLGTFSSVCKWVPVLIFLVQIIRTSCHEGFQPNSNNQVQRYSSHGDMHNPLNGFFVFSSMWLARLEM